MDKLSILGVKVNKLSFKEVVMELEKSIEKSKKIKVFTPNTEIVMLCQKDTELKKIINSGDIVTPDGIGLLYAAKIKGFNLKERVTGYDISLSLLEMSKKKDINIFLLGGKKGVAKNAKEKLNNEGYKNVIGEHHGYFFNEERYEEIENKIIKEINNLNTKILFVGFGSPKQEKWINKNISKLNCNIIIGNGGTIDVLSGEVKRSPKIYQRLGLEWLYRLVKNPKRIKRQISIPKFLIKVILDKNSVKNS